jgi:hypothetical protein
MNFSPHFFLAANGLFDFDLTFPIQALLFLILALIVTNLFLSPISKELDIRAQFIDYTLRKSMILLTFGYEKLSNYVGLFSEEMTEMNRQTKLIQNYTTTHFESEVNSIQKENVKILSKGKGDLAIQSAYLLSLLNTDLTLLTDQFFSKKFQSS